MQCLGRASTNGEDPRLSRRAGLPEIEAVLAEQPGVGTTAVLLRKEGGIDQLVAFYVPSGACAAEVKALRAGLAEKLPPYMVPARFEALPAMPRLQKRQDRPQGAEKPSRCRRPRRPRAATRLRHRPKKCCLRRSKNCSRPAHPARTGFFQRPGRPFAVCRAHHQHTAPGPALCPGHGGRHLPEPQARPDRRGAAGQHGRRRKRGRAPIRASQRLAPLALRHRAGAGDSFWCC